MFKGVEGASEPLTLIGCRKPDKLHAVSFLCTLVLTCVEFLDIVAILAAYSFGTRGGFPSVKVSGHEAEHPAVM
jgi:hypothetical protein